MDRELQRRLTRRSIARPVSISTATVLEQQPATITTTFHEPRQASEETSYTFLFTIAAVFLGALYWIRKLNQPTGGVAAPEAHVQARAQVQAQLQSHQQQQHQQQQQYYQNMVDAMLAQSYYAYQKQQPQPNVVSIERKEAAAPVTTTRTRQPAPAPKVEAEDDDDDDEAASEEDDEQSDDDVPDSGGDRDSTS